MKGKKEVEVEDVHAIIHDVFRHRLVISEYARMNNRTNDEIIDILLDQVPSPSLGTNEV